VRTIALALALLAVLLGAGTARAETSIYVAEQPGLSLLLKAEGGDVYATYMRAEILCYGAGGHWYEGARVAAHRAFMDGPVKLRRGDGRLRLVQGRNGPFESAREVIQGEIRPDGFVGSFSYYASGEGLGGTCEANAPGFEPEFGEKEPPVQFEARRYVPLDSPLETDRGAAPEDLYLAHSKALEIYLSVAGGNVTQVRGTALLTCANRKGKIPGRRRRLGLDPPYAIGEDRSFEAQEELDYGFRDREARLTGTVADGEVAGTLRIAGFNRSRDRKHIASRCLTGSRGGDGYVGYRASRYLPVKSGG
jgi:hypothetical protein